MNPESSLIVCGNKCDIIKTFRKLWTQHVMWTRLFIISTASDLGDLQYVTNRLLRNPSDFAEALKKYYGEEKANKFASLLTEHLTIAAKLVNAAKSGDTNTVSEERKKWYANADQIAILLAAINPNWLQNKWQLMLYDHLKITEDEAVYRLTKQYAKDVAIYDTIEDQALMMADDMANGIYKQFCV